MRAQGYTAGWGQNQEARYTGFFQEGPRALESEKLHHWLKGLYQPRVFSRRVFPLCSGLRSQPAGLP